MSDTVSPETRSRIMAQVRSKDTKPELKLRSMLYSRGFRYRLHDANLVGTPDLVFKKRRAVCFLHGCFWHRHDGCSNATEPSSRREYWLPKFERTITRDRRTRMELLLEGWRVAVVWECAMKSERAEFTVDSLDRWLRGNDQRFETPLQ